MTYVTLDDLMMYILYDYMHDIRIKIYRYSNILRTSVAITH